MNPLDMPAAPPKWGKLITLSETAFHLSEVFKDYSDEHDVAVKINTAIDKLRHDGYLREWGWDERGRILYAAEEHFDFDLRPANTTYTHPFAVYFFWKTGSNPKDFPLLNEEE